MKSLSFAPVYRNLCTALKSAPAVRTERWQGIDVSRDPSATTHELLNVDFEVGLQGIEDLDHWREDIRPNLPWADDHFAERVSGSPLNPGREWANWPWASSAEKFRNGEEKMFNHTYAERYWPKYPRRGFGGDYSEVARQVPRSIRRVPTVMGGVMRGISGQPYGDLQDLVEMIAREPYSRQHWMPIFYPEDTGHADGGRKPCTLGYQFIVREGEMHVWYPLRSCDLVKHFRDDCYLTVRLLLWVLDRCRELRPGTWSDVRPGTYSMHCTSLHVFENDRRSL